MRFYINLCLQNRKTAVCDGIAIVLRFTPSLGSDSGGNCGSKAGRSAEVVKAVFDVAVLVGRE